MQPSIMDVDDDFATRSAAFLSWLQASDATLSEKIELADLRQQNAGRGVGIAYLEAYLSIRPATDIFISCESRYRVR